MTPPRYAEALVRAVLIEDGDFRDGILGDMTEAWSSIATVRGVGAADRWYWRQAMRSMPSLLALWCETRGLGPTIGACAVAVLARMLMLFLQYAVIAVTATATQARPSPVASLVAVLGCAGVAATAGYLVRRVRRLDWGPTIGALCVASLLVHVSSARLISAALPVWLYWATAAPLSAVAVVVGAVRADARAA